MNVLIKRTIRIYPRMPENELNKWRDIDFGGSLMIKYQRLALWCILFGVCYLQNSQFQIREPTVIGLYDYYTTQHPLFSLYVKPIKK